MEAGPTNVIAALFTMNKRKRKDQDYWRTVLIQEKKACCVCGVESQCLLNAHHIWPVAEGGYAEMDNLVLLCRNCHGLAHQIRKNARRSKQFMPLTYAQNQAKHLDEAQRVHLLKIALYGLEIEIKDK